MLCMHRKSLVVLVIFFKIFNLSIHPKLNFIEIIHIYVHPHTHVYIYITYQRSSHILLKLNNNKAEIELTTYVY